MKRIILITVLSLGCISSYGQASKKNAVKQQSTADQPTAVLATALPDPSAVLIDRANPANNTGSGQLLIPIQVKPTSDGQQKKPNSIDKEPQQNNINKVTPKK